MKPTSVKALVLKLPSPGVLLALVLLGLHAIPAPGERWVIQEGPHYPGCFLEGAQGLRPVSCLEFLALGSGDGELTSLIALVLCTVGFIYRRHIPGFLVVTLISAVAFWFNAPVVGHRCQGPETACRGHLKNLGTAAEMFATDRGVHARSLEELCPNYLKTLPRCPLTDTPYTMKAIKGFYTFQCGPHPDHYFGNSGTLSGKSYLSRRPGGRTLVYSSSAGFGTLSK